MQIQGMKIPGLRKNACSHLKGLNMKYCMALASILLTHLAHMGARFVRAQRTVQPVLDILGYSVL